MQPTPVIVFPPFRLDRANERLWCGEQPIHLRPKTFAVLQCLLEHPGQLLTKTALLNTVWPETVVSEAVLLGCIRDLRRALRDDPRCPQFIETVHRRGYRFIGSITETAGSDAQRDLSPQQTGTRHAQLPGAGMATMPETMVGREAEFTSLHRYLSIAWEGTRQVVFVTGEAGLGKTTLVEAFIARAGQLGTLWIGRGQCVEHFGTGEAYMPVLEALGQLCQSPEGHALIDVLAHYAPTWLVQMPWLLSAIDLEKLQRSLQGSTRERMLREMAQALEVLTTERPLVLVLEDLHWSDYATLDLLSVLARRQEPARLLLLGTYRPEEVLGQEHPLSVVTQELLSRNACQVLPLTFLGEAAVADYLTARLPGTPGLSALARYIHQRTDGNPLFIVNIVEDFVIQNVMGAAVTLAPHMRPEGENQAIPESLRQLLEQRFERLYPEEQRVLETGSVAGVEFTAAVVAAGLDAAIEQVEAWCEGLVRRGRWLRAFGPHTWPDGTVSESYGFVHALYQEVGYSRVPAARRLRLHRQIGERLEAMYGEQAQDFATELAMHFEHGRAYRQAVRYRGYAAEQARRRHAYQEAIVHLTKGLDILPALSDTPERVQQELNMSLALGRLLMSVKGYAAPDVEQVYARAYGLCQQVEEPTQLLDALGGLWTYYLFRGQLTRAREIGEHAYRIAQRQRDPLLLMISHFRLGATFDPLGELVLCRTHLEQCLALFDPQQPRFVASGKATRHVVLYRLPLAKTLWMLGYPEQAMERIREAITIAQDLAHPFSLVGAFATAAALHQYRRESHLTQEYADITLALVHEHGFTQYAAESAIYQGWGMAMQGQPEEGMRVIVQGLDAFRKTGVQKGLPQFLAMLADVYSIVGQVEEGLTVLEEALDLVEQTEERQYESELYGVKGEFLLQLSRDNHTEAEACFQHALALARRQQAKSWELRAATSLARLWQSQGKRQEAFDLLAPIYEWFTEGFDTQALKDTKELLQDIAS